MTNEAKMTELSQGEGKSSVLRYLATVIYLIVLLITIVLNGLAGPGHDPFRQSTGNVSFKNEVCITPANYAFSIWGLIYFLLVFIAVYAIVILLRKVGIDRTWQLGGAVSVPFLLVLSLNLVFNVAWLFAWDAEQLIASFILLFLVALTNVVALSLSANSFKKSAPKLITTSKGDFWTGAIVLNSHAIYAMWTVIACLVNLGIMVADIARNVEGGRPTEYVENDTCIVILGSLLIGFIFHFILEQTIFKRIFNPIFIHYLVYIWSMVAMYVKNENTASTIVDSLTIANIVLGCILFILRIIFIYFRNRVFAMYKTI